mgnify:CR=1 FL=1
MTIPEYTFVFPLALAGIHVTAGRITESKQLAGLPILSSAGGTTVAYVFVLILPEINEAVLRVVERPDAASGFLARETGVYVVVLLGFLVFYGIHVYVTTARGEVPEASDLVFWVHVTSFAIYNGLIGYLLFHQETSGTFSLALYTVTMGLHFLVTDAGFRRHHGTVYQDVGRWVLAGSVLVGAAVGYATELHEAWLALLFAFLAGGIVFNVLIEELPEVEWRRFGAFLAGAVVYTTLLLLG